MASKRTCRRPQGVRHPARVTRCPLETWENRWRSGSVVRCAVRGWPSAGRRPRRPCGIRLDDADPSRPCARNSSATARADDLRCSSGLRAEVGESVRCTFTVDGPVDAVAITSVNGATVTYDVHTEARPRRRTLERSAARAGRVLAGSQRARDLPAQVGATVGCTLSGPTVCHPTVTTTSVDGGKIDYSIGRRVPDERAQRANQSAPVRSAVRASEGER